MSDWATLRAVGQPDRRLGNAFSYCSTGGKVSVQFGSNATVTRVVRP